MQWQRRERSSQLCAVTRHRAHAQFFVLCARCLSSLCAVARSCTSGTNCLFCAFEGATLQGTGACYTRGSANATACQDPVGQPVTAPGACALPGQTCEQFNTTFSSPCVDCEMAPESLNCGFCAATGQCLSGTSAGPNNGANCGSGGQGWGWTVEACTSQATCSAANNLGCTECYLQQPFSSACGYCASTGRCELVGVPSDSTPLDNDCGDNSGWFPTADTCVTPVPASDPCGQYADCESCENAPPAMQCGFCGVTQQCLTGDRFGPTATQPGCNNGNTWTFQSCPTDSVCATASDCTDCQAFENCVWCRHSSRCLPGIDGPIPSAGACSSVVTSWQTCPAAPPGPPGPAPPGPGAGDSPSFPAVGVWAIVALVVVGSFSVAAVLMYSCARKFDVPVLGSRIALARAGTLRDYSSGFLPYVPLLFALVSLALKLAALGLDQWDATYVSSTDFSFSIALKIFYGLFRARIIVTQSGAQEQEHIPDQSVEYKDSCVAFATAEGENTDLCKTLRASGIVVLILGVASALASFVLGAMSVGVLARRDRMPRWLVPMWRASGVAYITSLATFLSWTLAGHWVVHHPDGKAELGASSFAMLVAACVDVMAVWAARQAVTATPDPEAQAFRHSGDGGGGAHQEPYRVLRDFAHEGGPTHAGQALPQGYGAPVSDSYIRPTSRRSF